VAIKILLHRLSDRSELRERFESEAGAIASLNLPHICTFRDVGHQDGTNHLVMEYLQGETLAEKLTKDRCHLTKCDGMRLRFPMRSTRRAAKG
jgi:eukaryotic-like serine/threonine-protein kinase